jgi:hypothetical protein
MAAASPAATTIEINVEVPSWLVATDSTVADPASTIPPGKVLL